MCLLRVHYLFIFLKLSEQSQTVSSVVSVTHDVVDAGRNALDSIRLHIITERVRTACRESVCVCVALHPSPVRS